MQERPDHPHQAAVHLAKALRCCRDCHEVSEADLIELQELQYRKEMLADELRTLNGRQQSVQLLTQQIKELESLIMELRAENEEVHSAGMDEINRISTERQHIQNEQRQGIIGQLTAEKNLTRELSLELETLLERIKYLNRINNELIYNFCNV